MFSGFLRKNLFVIVLISVFPGVSIASDNDDFRQKFSEAEQLTRQGKVEKAITAYQSLIRLYPLHPEAYNNLAVIYLNQKNTMQAKTVLEQGLRAHKGYAALYENLTSLNIAMAREAYSKALQIDLKPSKVSIAAVSLDKKQANKNNISTAPAKNITGQKELATEEVTKITSEKSETETQTPVITEAVEENKNSEKIETILHAWSEAWSAQSVDVYLSFYHKLYKPSNGLSYKKWKQSRRYRLKKPGWIKVALSDLQIEENTGKQAIVKFKQSYQSDSFRDISNKEVVLLYTNDGWRIFREQSI